jgi:hypothetical protein
MSEVIACFAPMATFNWLYWFLAPRANKPRIGVHPGKSIKKVVYGIRNVNIYQACRFRLCHSRDDTTKAKPAERRV